MINRPGGVVLSHEEAARYTEDQRQNLRSWGIGVPEPAPSSPSEEVPVDPVLLPSLRNGLPYPTSYQPYPVWAYTGSAQVFPQTWYSLQTAYFTESNITVWP